MIEKSIKHEHIKKATEQVDKKGVPIRRKSVYYDLSIDGRLYPPKYIISLATLFATGKEPSTEDFNAVDAKNFLQSRGYDVHDRRQLDIEKSINKIIIKNQRKKILSLFSDLLIKADEVASNKWAVHLLKDKIRLLFGGLIVSTIQDDKIWMPLDSEYLDSNKQYENVLKDSNKWYWDLDDYPRYKTINSRNGYLINIDNKNEILLDVIKEAHFASLLKVHRKFSSIQDRSVYKHNQNLLEFIEKIIGMTLPTPEISFSDNTNITEEPQKPLDADGISETEREALTRSRIGQGRFRTNLKIYWGNECAVTDCTHIELLRASHIKPWSLSDNFERLDLYNGLLLIPNLDSAFDLGFISFFNDGTILISKRLSDNQKKTLDIREDMSLKKIDINHQKYLNYHRENVFRG